MLDLKIRALLGDREAQRRFTEQGELLPCNCGSEKLKLEKKSGKVWGYPSYVKSVTYSVRCNVCHARGGTASGIVVKQSFCDNLDKTKNLRVNSDGELISQAVSIWNTRASIITPGQIDFLGTRKCCRTCEFSNGNEYGDDEPVDHLNCSFNDTGDIWVSPDDYCSYGYKERVGGNKRED